MSLISRMKSRMKSFWSTNPWRSPTATFSAFLFIVCCVIAAVFVDRQHTYNIDYPPIRAAEVASSLSAGQSGIAIFGVRPVVDFTNAIVTITWMPYACGALSLDSPGCSRRFARAVDFFLDTPSSVTYTLDPSRIPRNPGDATDYFQLLGAWTFQYTHAFRSGTWDGHLDLQYYYPSDSLNSTSVFIAKDNVTGAQIQILKIGVPESPTGYFCLAHDQDVLVNVTSSSPGTTARLVAFTFYRSTTVKTFASVIVVLNWGLTLMVLHITLHYLIEGSRIEVPREILLLPVSVILMVPQLRAALPDVPRVGIMLDLIGYFFNLIIIAACSFVLVFLLIYQPKPQQLATNNSSIKESPSLGRAEPLFPQLVQDLPPHSHGRSITDATAV